MQGLTIYTIASNTATFQNIKNLCRSQNYIRLAGYSGNFEKALKGLNDAKSLASETNFLFIDDHSFNIVEIFSFLKTVNKHSSRYKNIIYTGSYESKYIENLSWSNVNGILHKEETPLIFPTDKCTAKIKPQNKTKFIDTIKLISTGINCYDGLINSIISKKYVWARGLDKPNLKPGKTKWTEQEIIEPLNKKIIHLLNKLTRREKELLLQIAEGKQNKVIANDLHISVGTVEQHKTHIIKKLNINSSIELTAFAIKNNSVLTDIEHQ